MLQEEKQAVVASAEKKNSVLQTLCKKLQAEKKALVQQLSQCVPRRDEKCSGDNACVSALRVPAVARLP
jgi:hypothetical protein